MLSRESKIEMLQLEKNWKNDEVRYTPWTIRRFNRDLSLAEITE